MRLNYKKALYRLGFTLAEVLIVLGIIGIVAEMTIPSLIKSTQDAEYYAGLKKAYAVLSQAQMTIAEENGSFSSAFTGCLGEGDIMTCLANLFKDKLKVSKECAPGAAFGDDKCFPAISDFRGLNGTSGEDIFTPVDEETGERADPPSLAGFS